MSRAKTAIILLVTVPLFLMAFCSAAVSQDASSPTGTDKSDSNSAEDRVDGSSDDAQGNVAPIVFQTIDQIIETLKHIGDSEDIADWQEYRAQAEAGGDRQFPLEVAGYSAKLANDMEKHNELLSADKLITDSLKIAPTIQADNPALFANIHYVAATIDIDFERYESSLQHLSTSLQIAEETGLERHVIVAFRAQRAFALRKLKRYDESEQIYSELIQLATEKADGLSQDDIYKLKLALAAMYAEKGAFRQYRDTCPDLDKHHVFEDGTRDWEGQLPKGIAFVNYQLAEGHDFKSAADKCQQLVEVTQQGFGVSSRRYIEAIELLAKVRVAQEQYDDALKLLKKSIDLRSGLLGETHPSIARVRQQIDSVRNQELDSAEHIFPLADEESQSEPADRYGERQKK